MYTYFQTHQVTYVNYDCYYLITYSYVIKFKFNPACIEFYIYLNIKYIPSYVNHVCIICM